jgi:enoyl-CoA hydratase/carnithine racemase
MNYETIRYTLADRILTITLDRPKQLNAFTVRMADELVHAFEAANSDDEVRAVVVTANGRAFCAGMDLSNEGNVFGLDETLRPTMRDLDERLDDAVITSRVRDTGGRSSDLAACA